MLILDGHCRPIDKLPARPLAAVLNSRQSKRPCNRDGWVTSTQKAVDYLIAHEYSVITSIGLNTWELVVHLVNVRGGSQVVILPPDEKDKLECQVREVISDFQLDPERCTFIVFSPEVENRRQPKVSWPERDLMAIDLAELAVPVSLRPNGTLKTLVDRASASGKSILDDFRAEYRPASDLVKYDFDGLVLNPELGEEGWNYLTHWTRSSHGRYSRETSHDYYRDIIGHDTYPRSALHTLSRIIDEGVIHGSGRFIRGGIPVVSFTGLPPSEAVTLMRWRRRYVYWNFEPYGVAIHVDAARAAGIRPVCYGDGELYEQLPVDHRPFFQNAGSEIADWRPEAEWRHIGDLNLRHLPADSVRLITFKCGEAATLQKNTKWQVIPLTID